MQLRPLYDAMAWADTDADRQKLDEQIRALQEQRKPIDEAMQVLQRAAEDMETQRRAKEAQVQAQRAAAENDRLYKDATEMSKYLEKAYKESQDRLKYLQAALTRAADDAAKTKINGEIDALKLAQVEMKKAYDQAVAQLALVAENRAQAAERAQRMKDLDRAQKEMRAMEDEYKDGAARHQALQESIQAMHNMDDAAR